MTRLFRLAAALLAGLGLTALTTADPLQVGELPPDFTLEASDGQRYTLSDFRDRQAVVIAWYPKAFTRGCTIECKSLAEHSESIRQYDVRFFMASVDPLEDNQRFAEATGADFPLLSDPDRSVAKEWGVLIPVVGVARRHTFYIDRDGRLLKIDRKINPATAAEDMMATLDELGIPRRNAEP